MTASVLWSSSGVGGQTTCREDFLKVAKLLTCSEFSHMNSFSFPARLGAAYELVRQLSSARVKKVHEMQVRIGSLEPGFAQMEVRLRSGEF